MEWGRVKTILILSFLFLNSLLSYQLWENRLDFLSLGLNENETTEVANLLHSKGIELRQDMPEGTPNVREISIAYKKQMKDGERVALSTPIEMPRNEEKWKTQLQQQIPEIADYELDVAMSREDEQIVFHQVINDLPLFQVNIVLDLEQQQVVRYGQSFVEETSLIVQEEQPALSAYRVLRLLAETKLTPGDVIEDIRLGYHGQIFEADTQVLAPKWRIVLQNGDIYYVHAISGEIE